MNGSSKVNILVINVQFEDKDPTPLMNLVMSNKQLGILAAEKAELPVEKAPELDKFKEVIREKKVKVALFKQRFLKEYQIKRKLFGTVELKSQEQQKTSQQKSKKDSKVDDDNNNNDESNKFSDHDSENTKTVCSFCLSDQDDVII